MSLAEFPAVAPSVPAAAGSGSAGVAPQVTVIRGGRTAGGPASGAGMDGPVVVTNGAAGDVVMAGATDAGASASGAGASGTTSNTGAAATTTPEARSAAGVHAAVIEYGNAVESRDLGRLARVYPGMTESQRRAWATFFGSVAGLRARLVVDEVTVAGATALARVRGTYEYENLRPRRAEHAPVSFTATLARDGTGWRVRTVE